jgi:hypothetical protein
MVNGPANAAAGAQSRSWREQYSFIVVLVAILVVGALFVFVMSGPGLKNLFTDPEQVLTALTSVFAVIGTLVGTYFGIRASGQAREESANVATNALNAVAQPTVEVPTLDGLTLTEAENKLASAGLTLGGRKNAPSSEEMKDKIVEQNPTARVGVSRGTPVDVTIGTGLAAAPAPDTGVNTGARKVSVPNVSGQHLLQAVSSLQAVGLLVGSASTEKEHDEIEKGVVVGTEPPVGSEVKRGHQVTLIVSSGPRV